MAIRGANGKLILRARLAQTVKIKRPEPTEEEIAAKRAEREAQERAWREEMISGWLDNADDRPGLRSGPAQDRQSGGDRGLVTGPRLSVRPL